MKDMEFIFIIHIFNVLDLDAKEIKNKYIFHLIIVHMYNSFI